MSERQPPIIDYGNRAPVAVAGGRPWSALALVIGSLCCTLAGLTAVFVIERWFGRRSWLDGLAAAGMLILALPIFLAGGAVLATRNRDDPKRGIAFLKVSMVILVAALAVRFMQLQL